MITQQAPRIPSQCPPAFQGRYTVMPGDTFYAISRLFRVRLEALAANNPHITNPSLLYPGDILCVPGLITFPCCIVLRPSVRVPFGTGGTALLTFAPAGGQSVLFAATLPQPSVFGNYDGYTGEFFIPGIGGFGNQLFPAPLDPPVWSTRVDLPTVAQAQPDSLAVVRPLQTATGDSGPVVLHGVFNSSTCRQQTPMQ